MIKKEVDLSEKAIDPEFVDSNAKYYHEEDIKEIDISDLKSWREQWD